MKKKKEKLLHFLFNERWEKFFSSFFFLHFHFKLRLLRFYLPHRFAIQLGGETERGNLQIDIALKCLLTR